MNIGKKLLLAVLFMAMLPFNLSAQSYDDMWKKVKEAENKGLPQTALKEIEPIYQKAIKEKDHAQAIKAVCKKIVTEGTIQGNSPEEKIIRFEKAVESSDKTIQPMLKVVLAKWYFHYYNRNRYKFMRRSTTSADADLKDFKTWDLPRLFGHIGKLYDSVLENEEELSKIPISKFDGFLEEGNQPTDLRSNLFEFFVHEALSFYGDNNQSTIKPQTAFEIDADSKVFDSVDEFIKWKPETLDSDSCNFKALKLYQRLLSLNKATNNENALLYNDIGRIQWAKKVALGPDKNDRYLEAMKRLVHEYPNNEYTSSAMYYVAKHYFEQNELVKAVDYAEKAYEKWPKSYGGKNAYNLINQIKAPQISYLTEKTITSNTNKIKVAFKNLKHVYFRLIKRTETDILNNNSTNGDSYNRGEVYQYLSQIPAYSFDAELDPESDYQLHYKLVDLPKLEKGFYWLIASTREDFKEENNAINLTAIQVSDLSLITRNAFKKGKNQVFVVDSVTGNPVEGAEVRLYYYNYQSRKLTHYSSATSNKSGSLDFSINKNDHFMLFCKHKNDMMYTDASWYNYASENITTEQKVYFFTDRSIYRPGQTLYFKAIAIKYNQETNEYSVIKNKKLEITLEDPNRQKVNSLELVTNEFGSVTGTFLTPTDRLPGNYTLKCSSIWSTTYIKVEEYKRPKFKVSIDAPKDGYQLGQTVKLKGQALAYTGAAIDNAEVKFRVKRMVEFPYWCWWIPRIDRSQEITHGTIKTNENGEFEISFTAKPDRSVDKKLDPIFSYSITADITDNTGETRSGARTVRIGYTAMELSIGVSEKINADQSFNLSIVSCTHDGEPVKAEGKVRIYKLIQPETPERHSYGISDVNDDRVAIRNMKEGEVVLEEKFATDEEGGFSKELTLPEGLYRIKAESEDRFGKETTSLSDIIVLSHSSSKMSVKLPFFFEIISKDLKPGDTFKAFWATGYDQGPAYIEICHRNKVLKSYWTDPNKNKEFISFPVSEEMRGGFFVKIFQVKENSYYGEDRYINVSWTTKNLKLKLVHFNSKMEPASKESWKVEVSGEDAEMKSIEMLASMYDASLDAYANHYWPGIYVFYSDRNSISNSFSNNKNHLSSFRNNFDAKTTYVGYIKFPSFPNSIVTDYYGYRYMDEGACFESNAMGGRMLMKSMGAPGVRASVQSIDCEEVCDSAVAEEPVMEKSMASNEAEEGAEGDSEKSEDIDLSKVKARSNLNETAFFLPQLTVNEKGIVSIDFEMPEALTTWKFMGFAHGTKLQSGLLTQEVITQKELMIQPNAPRFLREGDKIAFTVKVTNLSDKEQTGSVALELYDAITDESRNAEFKNNENKKSFTIPAKQSKGFSWILDVPYKPGFVRYKAVGATKTHSDGEEGLLPILSSRILVTESTPLPIRGPETKTFKFEKLQKSGESKTLEHKGLTVEMTSNPAWYAIQALPYLIEFPHECSEQTFNRIYANKLAQHIANSNPKIRRVFDIWLKDELYNKGTALMSNLEKNQHLKSVTLMETPWVLDAKDENEQKHHIGVLFEESRLNREIEAATKKLNNMQLEDGSFPWFPGGYGNTFITMYIMTGYGRLRNLGVQIDLVTALRCADFVDQMVREYYEKIILHDKEYKEHVHIDSTIAFYLYGRSFFLKDRPIPGNCKVAVDYFIEQAQKYWLKVPYRMSQAHIALGLQRFGDKQTPLDIVKSIKERSVTDEEMGRFWRENEIGYSWNRADIETQAMMIEMFSEITKDEEAVEDCKVWLLKQKQTQCWKTTKSTADAIYALILRGCDLLASDKVVKVYLNNEEVKPEKIEAGTGYYQKIYSGAEIKPQMGDIQVKKEDKGVAWGAVHWQYIEDMSKVTPFENNLKLKKSLYIKTNTEKGPVINPVKDGKVRVGDLVVVRIELRTDRDLEFVHMKDQRGSGMEPVNVISRYKWQDGLGYYEATKDSASHFYIDYLPKGTYVFEYELRVQLAGQYQTGIAEIMCMYAPEFNSHSESFMLNVEAQ